MNAQKTRSIVDNQNCPFTRRVVDIELRLDYLLTKAIPEEDDPSIGFQCERGSRKMESSLFTMIDGTLCASRPCSSTYANGCNTYLSKA